MRFSTLAGAAMATAPAFGREMPKDEVRGAELYDSGVVHEALMNRKIVRNPQLYLPVHMLTPIAVSLAGGRAPRSYGLCQVASPQLHQVRERHC